MLNAFQNARAKLNRIFHALKPQLFPKFLGWNIISWLREGFFSILNVNIVFNLLKQFKLINGNQCSDPLPSPGQNNRFFAVSHLVNNISKIFSRIRSRNCNSHNFTSPRTFVYKLYNTYLFMSMHYNQGVKLTACGAGDGLCLITQLSDLIYFDGITVFL